jgi:hypothetical protein
MSRAVNVSPVATNEEVYKFHHYNKGNIKKQREHIINGEIPKLHDYINYIKQFYEGIEIINPYWTCLEGWFKSSEYYKRALTLYPGLVEAVCLLNYSFRETVNVGDNLYLIATKEDNQIIADLFNPSQGISEPAVRLFNLILKWYNTYDQRELAAYQNNEVRLRDCKSIFSVSDIRHKATKIKAMKGLTYGDIMSTLVNHGLIEPIDKVKRGKMNVYALSHHESLIHAKIEFDNKKVLDYIKDLEMMFGVQPGHLEKIINQENEVKTDEGVKTDLKLPEWASGWPLGGRQWPQVDLGGLNPPKKWPEVASKTEEMAQTTGKNHDKSEDNNILDEVSKDWEAFS